MRNEPEQKEDIEIMAELIVEGKMGLVDALRALPEPRVGDECEARTFE